MSEQPISALQSEGDPLSPPVVTTVAAAPAVGTTVATDPMAEPMQILSRTARMTAFWGLLNLLPALSSGFAVALLLLAALTYRLRTVAFFAVHALFFVWAALVNVALVGTGIGFFWAILLVVSAVVELRLYMRHREAEAGYLTDALVDTYGVARARRRLPVAAAGAGIGAWIVFLAGWIGTFVVIAAQGDGAQPPAVFLFLISFATQLGALAVALGAGALLTVRRRRWLAVTGIAAGGFVALLMLLISLFSG